MHRVKGLLLLLMILILAGFVFSFVLENQQAVSFVFMGWVAPPISIGIMIMVALLMGLLAGPLLGVFIVLRARSRMTRAID